MKIFIKTLVGITFLILFLVMPSIAQEETENVQDNVEYTQEDNEEFEDSESQQNEMQTLVSPGGTGGYGGFTVGYSQIGDYAAFSGGIRAGVVLGHSFTLGFGGYGFITEQFQNPVLNESNYYQLAGGYGGILMEAIVLPMQPVHISIPVIFGAGGLSYFRSYNFHDSYDWDSYDYSDIDHDAFFVIEPGIELDVNMLKFMRISLGGSYRFSTDVSLTTYVNDNGTLTEEILAPDDIMNGWNVYLTFKFGKF